MRLRRFVGSSTQDAVAQVKAALGADAVVLETREEGGCVVITAATDADERSAPAAPPAEGLTTELRELMALVRHLVAGGERPPAGTPELVRLHGALLAQGVDAGIAAALVRETAARLGDGGLDAALAETVARPALPPARVRFFVGPPGDGKTTIVAKLAARERHAGRRVAIVGTDTHGIGAGARLETYGRALGVPVALAATPTELSRTLAGARADVVLVDTAGPATADELVALIDAGGPQASRTLVASAAAGPAAAERLCAAFAPVVPEACVVTKLDLAPPAPLLAALWRQGVAVSHLAAGPRVRDELDDATPARLTRALVAA